MGKNCSKFIRNSKKVFYFCAVCDIIIVTIFYSEVIVMSKNFWRGLWIVAVALGGVSLVKVALDILHLNSKKYIDV